MKTKDLLYMTFTFADGREVRLSPQPNFRPLALDTPYFEQETERQNKEA